jgi:methylaspartate mutase epsilon subunit
MPQVHAAAWNPGFFHLFIEAQGKKQSLVLQPRMGFSGFAQMRAGLEAVYAIEATTIGTITLDSYTRTGNFAAAAAAVVEDRELNGYPIVAYGEAKNRELIAGLQGPRFPIQVRHGSPRPDAIFRSLIEAGIDATEGGPISYCLPYSRVPLRSAIASWTRCCRLFARFEERGTTPHLESFGGCMLGQLCPPALLLAITVLEGLFFRRNGLRSISLSYAQGTNSSQDVGAILALRRLAAEFLPDSAWHVVVYCFMGDFPRTRSGARKLIEESARISVLAGAERLIVKTASEARQVPSIEDNLEAIRWSHEAAQRARSELTQRSLWHSEVLYLQARSLIEAVLDLDRSLERGLATAFAKGYLDVPYCLHPDNRNVARSWVDGEGAIQWAETGAIPFPAHLRDTLYKRRQIVTSGELARMLALNRRKYDGVRRSAPRSTGMDTAISSAGGISDAKIRLAGNDSV